jgi:hypothetical protein
MITEHKKRGLMVHPLPNSWQPFMNSGMTPRVAHGSPVRDIPNFKDCDDVRGNPEVSFVAIQMRWRDVDREQSK